MKNINNILEKNSDEMELVHSFQDACSNKEFYKFITTLPIEEKVSDAPNKEGAISVIDPDDEVSKRFVEIVKDIQKEFTKE